VACTRPEQPGKGKRWRYVGWYGRSIYGWTGSTNDGGPWTDGRTIDRDRGRDSTFTPGGARPEAAKLNTLAARVAAHGLVFASWRPTPIDLVVIITTLVSAFCLRPPTADANAEERGGDGGGRGRESEPCSWGDG